METVNEYRIKITVRNNLLLSAIEQAGYKSQTEFAEAADISKTALNALVGLRKAPIGANGSFIHEAKMVMEALGACPTDLWTEEQLTMELKRNTSERSVGGEAMQLMLDRVASGQIEYKSPEDALQDKMVSAQVENILQQLTPREYRLLKHRYADEMSLEEVGKVLKLTKERIRQMENKAFRKLLNPSRREVLFNLIHPETKEERERITKYWEKYRKQTTAEKRDDIDEELQTAKEQGSSWAEFLEKNDPELYQKLIELTKQTLEKYK